MSTEINEEAARRREATADYRKKLLQHKELEYEDAVRKLNDAKKLESSSHYNADFGKD